MTGELEASITTILIQKAYLQRVGHPHDSLQGAFSRLLQGEAVALALAQAFSFQWLFRLLSLSRFSSAA